VASKRPLSDRADRPEVAVSELGDLTDSSLDRLAQETEDDIRRLNSDIHYPKGGLVTTFKYIHGLRGKEKASLRSQRTLMRRLRTAIRAEYTRRGK